MHNLYNVMFTALVEEVGSASARSAIEAKTGSAPSVGTFTKIANGSLSVPMEWAFILEDFTRNYCFTNHRSRQLQAKKAEAAHVSHLEALRETSEMILALGKAEETQDPAAIAKAITETAQVMDVASAVLDQLRDQLDLIRAEGVRERVAS